MDQVYTAGILYIKYCDLKELPHWQDPSKKEMENYATEDLILPRLETFMEKEDIPYFHEIFAFPLEHDVAEQSSDKDEQNLNEDGQDLDEDEQDSDEDEKDEAEQTE